MLWDVLDVGVEEVDVVNSNRLTGYMSLLDWD
jgi:hypothetical protein